MRKINYDVRISIPVKGLEDKWVDVAYIGNITWNVKRLILESSGWNIKNEDNNGGVMDWMNKIQHGLRELLVNPGKYKQYEAVNGWGTVEGTKQFYKDCLNNASDWISCNEDLIQVAVIWVH